MTSKYKALNDASRLAFAELNGTSPKLADQPWFKKNVFGNFLRSKRKEAGRTLKDLARCLGISVAYLSDIERGNRAPLPTDQLERISKFLSVDLAILRVKAAETRGVFELEPISPQHRRTGTALMQKWDSLPESILKEIEKIVNR